MPRATGDAKLLIQSLNKAYAATPTNLKVAPFDLHCHLRFQSLLACS